MMEAKLEKHISRAGIVMVDAKCDSLGANRHNTPEVAKQFTYAKSCANIGEGSLCVSLLRDTL